MSTRILNPVPLSRRATLWKNSCVTRKYPLIGSETRHLQTKLLIREPRLLSRTRLAAKSPMLPPSKLRLQMTISKLPVWASASMRGSTVSSCCMSPSLTATNGAAVERIPSMHAEDSPRRPRRCKHHRSRRPRAALCAIPSATCGSAEIQSRTTGPEAASASVRSPAPTGGCRANIAF